MIFCFLDMSGKDFIITINTVIIITATKMPARQLEKNTSLKIYTTTTIRGTSRSGEKRCSKFYDVFPPD